MSEMASAVEQAPQVEEKTTVGAWWSDSTKIRELKKRLGMSTQQDVIRHLLEFYEKHGQSGKEEADDGVHSG